MFGPLYRALKTAFLKKLQYDFLTMREGVKGRLEFSQKFIGFGTITRSKGESKKEPKTSNRVFFVIATTKKRSFLYKKGRWRGWLTLMIYPAFVFLCIFVGTKETSCIHPLQIYTYIYIYIWKGCFKQKNYVTRAPLLYFIRSWVALSFKVVSEACVTPFQISTSCNI